MDGKDRKQSKQKQPQYDAEDEDCIGCFTFRPKTPPELEEEYASQYGKTKSAKVFSESQQKLSLGSLSESLTAALLDLSTQDRGSTSAPPRSTDVSFSEDEETDTENEDSGYSPFQSLDNESKGTDTVSASTRESKIQAGQFGRETSTDTAPITMKDNESQANLPYTKKKALTSEVSKEGTEGKGSLEFLINEVDEDIITPEVCSPASSQSPSNTPRSGSPTNSAPQTPRMICSPTHSSADIEYPPAPCSVKDVSPNQSTDQSFSGTGLSCSGQSGSLIFGTERHKSLISSRTQSGSFCTVLPYGSHGSPFQSPVEGISPASSPKNSASSVSRTGSPPSIPIPFRSADAGLRVTGFTSLTTGMSEVSNPKTCISEVSSLKTGMLEVSCPKICMLEVSSPKTCMPEISSLEKRQFTVSSFDKDKSHVSTLKRTWSPPFIPIPFRSADAGLRVTPVSRVSTGDNAYHCQKKQDQIYHAINQYQQKQIIPQLYKQSSAQSNKSASSALIPFENRFSSKKMKPDEGAVSVPSQQEEDPCHGLACVRRPRIHRVGKQQIKLSNTLKPIYGKQLNVLVNMPSDRQQMSGDIRRNIINYIVLKQDSNLKNNTSYHPPNAPKAPFGTPNQQQRNKIKKQLICYMDSKESLNKKINHVCFTTAEEKAAGKAKGMDLQRYLATGPMTLVHISKQIVEATIQDAIHALSVVIKH